MTDVYHLKCRTYHRTSVRGYVTRRVPEPTSFSVTTSSKNQPPRKIKHSPDAECSHTPNSPFCFFFAVAFTKDQSVLEMVGSGSCVPRSSRTGSRTRSLASGNLSEGADALAPPLGVVVGAICVLPLRSMNMTASNAAPCCSA